MATEPWTAPIGLISVTVTVNEHVPLCGVASPLVAVISTVYVPGATVDATDTVAEAVPPAAPAGVWLVIAIPAAAGVTVALKPITVPSGSVAVTLRVAVSPWSTLNAPPQVTVTPWFGGGVPGQELAAPGEIGRSKKSTLF